MSKARLKKQKLQKQKLEDEIVYNLSVGRTCTQVNNFYEALRKFQQADQLCEKRYKNKTDSDYLNRKSEIHFSVAFNYFHMKQYGKAENHYIQSIDFVNRIKNPSKEFLLKKANVYNNFGNVYTDTNRQEKAIICLEESKKIKEKIYKQEPHHPELFFLYNNMGLIYNIMQDGKNAVFYLKKARDIGEILSKSSDKSCKEAANIKMMADIYNNLGQAHLMLKDYEESKKAHFSSLKLNTEIYGKEAKEFAILNNYYNIGLSFKEQKNYLLASKFLQKAYDTASVLYKNTSVVTAEINYLLGGSLLQLAKNAEEEKAAHKFLNNSALGYLDLGIDSKNARKYQKALKEFELAKKSKLMELDGEQYHLGIAGIYCNIGMVHYEIRDYDSAKKSYHKACEIYQKIYKDNIYNADIANIHSLYNALYIRTEEYQKAVNHGAIAIGIKREIYKHLPNNLELSFSLLKQGDLYHKIKDIDRAKKYFLEALNGFKQHEDKGTCKQVLSAIYQRLGDAYFDLKDIPKTKEYFAKALSMYPDAILCDTADIHSLIMINAKMGEVCIMDSSYADSNEYLNKAISLAEKYNINNRDIAYAYINLCKLKMNSKDEAVQKEISTAIAKATRISELLDKDDGHYLQSAECHYYKAASYLNNHKSSRAKKEYEKAIELINLAESCDDGLILRADIYIDISSIYMYEREYHKAMEYLKKSKLIKTSLTNIGTEEEIYYNYMHGLIYYKLNNYEKAEEYFCALKICSKLIPLQKGALKIHTAYRYAESLYHLAKIQAFKGLEGSAEKYFYSAIDEYSLLEKDLDAKNSDLNEYEKSKIYKNMGDIYFSINSHELAIKYLKKHFDEAKNLTKSEKLKLHYDIFKANLCAKLYDDAVLSIQAYLKLFSSGNKNNIMILHKEYNNIISDINKYSGKTAFSMIGQYSNSKLTKLANKSLNEEKISELIDVVNNAILKKLDKNMFDALLQTAKNIYFIELDNYHNGDEINNANMEKAIKLFKIATQIEQIINKVEGNICSSNASFGMLQRATIFFSDHCKNTKTSTESSLDSQEETNSLYTRFNSVGNLVDMNNDYIPVKKMDDNDEYECTGEL